MERSLRETIASTNPSLRGANTPKHFVLVRDEAISGLGRLLIRRLLRCARNDVELESTPNNGVPRNDVQVVLTSSNATWRLRLHPYKQTPYCSLYGSNKRSHFKSSTHIFKLHPRGFTAKYNVEKLGYYRFFSTIEEALAEEKRIKGGSRQKKIDLIESLNPTWEDLWIKEVSKW